MTDPAETAHDVLVKVAEFVRKLPADQLADLLSGEARLELVTKRPVAKKAAVATLPRPAEEIAATLRARPDRAGARRFLDAELRLPIPLLKELAKQLDVPVAARATKIQILDALVEWGVGRRLDSAAIEASFQSR
jgi:hypothetical protein